MVRHQYFLSITVKPYVLPRLYFAHQQGGKDVNNLMVTFNNSRITEGNIIILQHYQISFSSHYFFHTFFFFWQIRGHVDYFLFQTVPYLSIEPVQVIQKTCHFHITWLFYQHQTLEIKQTWKLNFYVIKTQNTPEIHTVPWFIVSSSSLI